jgi:AcrR family transcriptional regulator
MAVRRDGIESKDRLLKAATEVFAEKGYRDATVAEICRRAESNVAAVNYHFGSKDELYATVWRRCFDEAMKVYPPTGGLGDDAPADRKLEAFISSALHRILDRGRLGYSGQILLREMSEPTEVISNILSEVIKPLKQRTREIIIELLGEQAQYAGKDEVFFCQLSVVHQVLAIGFRRSTGRFRLDVSGNENLFESIDELAEHITLFSLAGIAAVKEKIRRRVAY